VVVLIDETQQSAAETYTHTIKNITNATSIGTPTGGAYAYFVNYIIPGNIRLWLSGSVISRRGIQPDIFVEPTISGIRTGRDEVLDRAIEFLQTGK
jgi:C-terminal processing protease CtpA/Prc